jgi:small subunit ribosomal protein S2
MVGRFLPGILTNPNYEYFIEPEIVLITDPIMDKQALIEASNSNLPIVALCNTFNVTSFIDLIIPCNNRGRKSVALIFFLLAREILKERGVIQNYDEFKYKIEDFIEPKKKRSR